MVERGACSGGLDEGGEGQYPGGWVVQIFQLFFLFAPVSTGEKGKEATSSVKLHLHLGLGAVSSFDDALKTLLWGRVSQGCYLSGFEIFETLLALLNQG